MNLPEGLAIDSSGNVWASDYFNNRVLEFLNPVKSGLVEGEASFHGTGADELDH